MGLRRSEYGKSWRLRWVTNGRCGCHHVDSLQRTARQAGSARGSALATYRGREGGVARARAVLTKSCVPNCPGSAMGGGAAAARSAEVSNAAVSPRLNLAGSVSALSKAPAIRELTTAVLKASAFLTFVGVGGIEQKLGKRAVDR